MNKLHSCLYIPFLLSAITLSLSAATINSAVISGGPADPVFTIQGSGFLPAPSPTSSASGSSFTGLDYGNLLYLMDTSLTPPFSSFTAGYDFGGFHNSIGLSVLSYSNTSISFHLGSEYTLVAYPNKQFGIKAGDTVTVFVQGTTAVATFAAVNAIPEPNPALLLFGGLIFLPGLLRRSRSTRSC